jgi:hypothetical protein
MADLTIERVREMRWGEVERLVLAQAERIARLEAVVEEWLAEAGDFVLVPADDIRAALGREEP